MVKLQLKFNAAVIKEFPIAKAETTIGRKPDNDIVIDNPAVSGHHARIVRQGDEFFIEDLNSTNGTFLKGQKVLKAGLKSRDEVAIAKHSIVFMSDEAVAAPAAAQSVSSESTVVMTAPRPKPAGEAAKPPAESIGALRVVEGETNAPLFSLVGLTTYIGKSDQAQIRIKGFFAADMAACVARKPEG